MSNHHMYDSDGKLKHTPAPWTVREGFLIHSEQFGQIANVRGATGSEELAANTSVIAAAPDMYALLDHFRNNVSGASDLDIELFDKAVRELLAKVEA